MAEREPLPFHRPLLGEEEVKEVTAVLESGWLTTGSRVAAFEQEFGDVIGAQALALQRERPAELLITDIFMPGQEGFETISRFRAEFPQTRIIVMSAGNVPGMQHDFLSTAALLGVGTTLRKPFDADQLLDAVRRVLPPR